MPGSEKFNYWGSRLLNQPGLMPAGTLWFCHFTDLIPRVIQFQPNRGLGSRVLNHDERVLIRACRG